MILLSGTGSNSAFVFVLRVSRTAQNSDADEAAGLVSLSAACLVVGTWRGELHDPGFAGAESSADGGSAETQGCILKTSESKCDQCVHYSSAAPATPWLPEGQDRGLEARSHPALAD